MAGDAPATLIEHPPPHTPSTHPIILLNAAHNRCPPLAPYAGTVGSIDKSQDGKIFVEKYDAKTQKTPITIPVSAG
jgi:hypothetical protein